VVLATEAAQSYLVFFLDALVFGGIAGLGRSINNRVDKATESTDHVFRCCKIVLTQSRLGVSLIFLPVPPLSTGYQSYFFVGTPTPDWGPNLFKSSVTHSGLGYTRNIFATTHAGLGGGRKYFALPLLPTG
jgi:hypothetical protein